MLYQTWIALSPLLPPPPPTSSHAMTHPSSVWKENMSWIKADLVLGIQRTVPGSTHLKHFLVHSEGTLGVAWSFQTPGCLCEVEMTPFKKLDGHNPTLNHSKKLHPRALLLLDLASRLAFHDILTCLPWHCQLCVSNLCAQRHKRLLYRKP